MAGDDDFDLDDELEDLPDWTVEDEGRAIVRRLKFKDFADAFTFMTRVAIEAETLGHHPDWSNGYNRVTISLTTHDAGGVTEKDVMLAHAIDEVAERWT